MGDLAMRLFNTLKEHAAQDRNILRSLTLRQKLRFCVDYYRGYLFLFLICCLALFYIGDLVVQSRKDTVLHGFFTNDDYNLFPAGTISGDFSKQLDLKPDQQVIFEDSLYVEIGSGKDYTTSSQSKILAYISARELDFIVTTEDLMHYYSSSFLLYDLEELLPEDMAGQLAGQLYHGKDGAGENKACALNLAGSRFLTSPLPAGAPGYYLMVLSYTGHQDAITAFIQYAFEHPTSAPFESLPRP